MNVEGLRLSIRFRRKMGYWPNLSNPGTLQEKILWRNLHGDMSGAVRLADKVAVRDYVREKAGDQHLVEALAVADRCDELEIARLPQSFVVKFSHGSGMNIFVWQRSEADEEALRKLVASRLERTYGLRKGEHWYARIRPRALVETLVTTQGHDLPVDYRFHVFHGRARFIQVASSKRVTGREPGEPSSPRGYGFIVPHSARHAIYTRDWQRAPFQFRSHVNRLPPLLPKPRRFDEMIRVAETLGDDWGYVRVDLYCTDEDRVLFSEMTFAPNSGLFRFVPDSHNHELGRLWNLPERRRPRR